MTISSDFSPPPPERSLRALLDSLAEPTSNPDELREATGSALAALLRSCHDHGWDVGGLIAEAFRASEAPLPDLTLAPTLPRKVAVFTGSFDPPTLFHRAIAEQLRVAGFDQVVIRPEGPRENHPEENHAAPIHRAAMTDLGFRGLPWVTVDLTDIDDQKYTPHREIEGALAAKLAPTGGSIEVWHVVSDDFVLHGRDGDSTIQSQWESGPELWDRSRFVVFHATGARPDPADLPPNCQLLTADGYMPSGHIRTMLLNGGPDIPDELVTPQVAEYIRRHWLFTGELPPREVRIILDRLRLKIVLGPQPEALRKAERFRHLVDDAHPNLILVIGGDGTMLRAIRHHWRLRVPFLGLNSGHLGHLVNDELPDDLGRTELVLYRMPMLRVDTLGDDGVETRGQLAFNDAWAERDGGQGAWFRLDVNGEQRVSKVVADGLLAATPSGSAAYARAMGATPVPLNSPVITLAGSNVFSPRFWKPLALPDHTVIRMTSIGEPGKRPVRGFLDGEPLGRIKSMEVRVSQVASVELAFTPKFDLSAKLLRSLFPPDDEKKKD